MILGVRPQAILQGTDKTVRAAVVLQKQDHFLLHVSILLINALSLNTLNLEVKIVTFGIRKMFSFHFIILILCNNGLENSSI